MKISSKTISLTVCLLGLLMFPACLDIETTSRVNPDGSVLRTITFTDDSAGTYRGDFPIPLDSTWRQTTEKVGEDKFTVTASRLFRDVDEMNRTLKGTFGKTLQSEFALERTFQWFFTSYRFTERSLKYVQYDSIPLTDFVSAAEVESWERHEVEKKPFSTKGDSLAMMSAEKRGVEWEIRNVFEPIFATFLEGVGAVRDPRLNRSFVESQKDTLY
ncbi:MAG TPA: hypothetical protein VMM37_10730, partial [Bacteroidota bacterium]|nr:hypothetical protein [Bacteroidota bacterium]